MVLVRLMVPLLLLGILVMMLRRRPSAAVTRDCRSCKHCRELFPDGTICGFGRKEVFKNEVHVKNCTDYTPRSS